MLWIGEVMWYYSLQSRFYRAMPCIAQTMPSQFRLSHTGILSKRFNVSSNLLHRRVGTPFSFLQHQTWQYSDSDLPNRGVECKGYEKIAIFDHYLAMSHKWYKIRHCYYRRRIGKRTQAFEWYHFQWPCVILTQISRSRYYSTSNNWKMVQDRANLTTADQ